MRSLLSGEKGGEKVYELARNICEAGTLDPGDRLYVMAAVDKVGRYIVLEGNRRLTALRLLSQPGMIDREDLGLSSAMRAKFKKLQAESKDRWPTVVDVVVFLDRDSANHFIRLRHTGENSGAGRSAWSALQVARFDDTGLWKSLVFLRADNALDLAVINALDTSTFNVTNYDRVSSTQEFQRRFGVAIGRSTFKVTGNETRAKLALSKLASDVESGRVDSRGEFAEAKGMLAYLITLDEVVTVSSRVEETPVEEPNNVTPIRPFSPAPQGEPWNSSGDPAGHEINIPEPDSKGDKPRPAAAADIDGGGISLRPIRKPRTTKYLIDKKELLTVSNQKCRAIVDELKSRVEVQKAPFACALLLRSLQELTADIYVSIMDLKAVDRSAKIDAAANHLLGKPHPTDTLNKNELALAFKKSRDAYDELSAAAHHSVVMVSPEHVRSTWDNLKGGTDLLWKRIHAEELSKKSNAAA